MRKTPLLIVLLTIIVISACSSTTPATTLPPSTTPTPKCKESICIQEAVVLVDDQTLSVAFTVTDQNGQLDADNPPQFKDDYLSVDVYHTGTDGEEKSVFGVYQPSNQFQCTVTNLTQLFKGRLVDLCGVFTPQTSTSVKIQAGDSVRVALKEFDFEQVVIAREPPKLGAPNTTATSIADAFLTKERFGSPNISVTTLPQNQAVIRLFVIVANASADTKVKVAWTVVDIGDVAPANTKLGEVEYPPNGTDVYVFTLEVPDSGVWPIGKYKADIYLNGKLDRVLEYNIE
jgi:hypothetical protein